MNNLIDSGASSPVNNPEIAHELFPNYIFPDEFEIINVHNRTKGTQALTYLILSGYCEYTLSTLPSYWMESGKMRHKYPLNFKKNFIIWHL